MLHGIIDIGSNTIRMAIYNIIGTSIEQLYKTKNTVGLAGYVEDGAMSQAGIDVAVGVLKGYVDFLRSFRIENVAAFTTAALRNATNSREAVAAIEECTGLTIRVITGDEEATFDFVGATHSIPADDGLILDIGGGSTEIVAYESREIREKISLPIGSLALRKKYVHGILPTPEELLGMWGEVRETLSALPDFQRFSEVRAPEVVGIGGTFKGGIALYNALFNQPKSNSRLETRRIKTIVSTFAGGELTEELAIMLMRTVPDRIYTVIPGLVIADCLAGRFGTQVITYSDSGVREGYIYSEIAK